VNGNSTEIVINTLKFINNVNTNCSGFKKLSTGVIAGMAANFPGESTLKIPPYVKRFYEII